MGTILTASESLASFSMIFMLTNTIITIVAVLYFGYLILFKPWEYIKITDKTDGFLDKIFKKKTNPIGQQEKPSSGQENNNENDVKDEEQLTHLVLYIGESYRCHIMRSTVKYLNSSSNWYSTNEFIAKVSPMGFVKALHVGKTKILIGDIEQYEVDVIPPANLNWRLKDFISMVIENASVEEFMAIPGKWTKPKGIHELKIDEQHRILSFRPERGANEIIKIQYDSKNNINRFLYCFTSPSQNTIESQKVNLGFFMEPLENTNYKYWYHFIDGGIDSVGFMKPSHDLKVLYIGFEACWRSDSELQEIEDNPAMIERDFIDLLPASEIPEVKAVEKTEKEEEKQFQEEMEGNKSEINIPYNDLGIDENAVYEDEKTVSESNKETEDEDEPQDESKPEVETEIESEPEPESEDESMSEYEMFQDDIEGSMVRENIDIPEEESDSESAFEN